MDLDDKVKDMLAMPVSSEPDSAIDYRALVKRIVTVEDSYFDGSCFSGARIIIEAAPQDIKHSELHDRSFSVFYNGSIGAVEQGKKLMEFLKFFKGQEAYMVYMRRYLGGTYSPVLHMIAPMQINQPYSIYAKGDNRNDRLGPYVVKNQILEILSEKNLVVQDGGSYRLNAPVLTR